MDRRSFFMILMLLGITGCASRIRFTVHKLECKVASIEGFVLNKDIVTELDRVFERENKLFSNVSKEDAVKVQNIINENKKTIESDIVKELEEKGYRVVESIPDKSERSKFCIE